MKHSFFFIALLCASSQSLAQSFSEAMNWALPHPITTPTASSLGNALGAAGGDLSSLHLNPAGLASYKTGALSVYAGYVTTTDDSGAGPYGQHKAPIGGGLVLPIRLGAKKAASARTLYLAAAYHRQLIEDLKQYSNFSNRSVNSNGSLVSWVAQQSEGIPRDRLDPIFGQALLEGGYMLEVAPNSYEADPLYRPNPNKQGVVQQRGQRQRLELGGGMALSKRLQLGFSCSIPLLNYTLQTNYNENSLLVGQPYVLYHKLNQEVSGWGVGLRLGATYQLNEQFSLGATVASPTVVLMQKNYALELSSGSPVIQTIPPHPPINLSGTQHYTMLFGGGGSVQMSCRVGPQQSSVLMADLGAQSIRSSYWLRRENRSMEAINQPIKRYALLSPHVRVGLDFAMGGQWRCRLGGAFSGTGHHFSLGGGWLGKHLNVHLAARYGTIASYYDAGNLSVGHRTLQKQLHVQVGVDWLFSYKKATD